MLSISQCPQFGHVMRDLHNDCVVLHRRVLLEAKSPRLSGKQYSTGLLSVSLAIGCSDSVSVINRIAWQNHHCRSGRNLFSSAANIPTGVS